MSALFVGYARCSTEQQDLTAQREALATLGVSAERMSALRVLAPLQFDTQQLPSSRRGPESVRGRGGEGGSFGSV
jgi:hypothetical protein